MSPIESLLLTCGAVGILVILGVIASVISVSARHFFASSWSIAVYTWREGMRKKTLIGFLILSILVIFGSSFMTAFLAQTTIGDLESDVDLKLIKDICVTAISIFGVLITIFISASVVPNEIENKVIYTVLSKPVRRFGYLLGKFIGVQLIVIVNLALMGGLFFIALYFKQRMWPTLLLWSILLTYFQFLIVSAFTFAISCAASSAVLPTIAGLFIFITGNLTEYLKEVYNRGGQSGAWFDEAIRKLAYGLYQILPNLQNFSLKDEILYLQVNDPPRDVMIPNLIAYGLLFALAGYIVAYVVFWRREL
ncbi:MAG TPA: ABC transporter permease [Candidatus Hydrogenedentes bacterium]|nr:ABC transporter permease [Candidatus Hydrogenedentota bacterium]HPG65321.1 ABC transporter permease [Candidatus Hydrogenedentota bacterium]